MYKLLVILMLFFSSGVLADSSPLNLEEVKEMSVTKINNKSSSSLPTEVWTGDDILNNLRDPAIYQHNDNSYILSGTGRAGILEYKDILNMTPLTGEDYELKLYTTDGLNLINEKNRPWVTNFYKWDDDIYMYSSFLTPYDNDFSKGDNLSTTRRIYVLSPLENSLETEGGFPIEWKLVSNNPFFSEDSYSGWMFKDNDSTFFIHTNGKPHTIKDTVCILSREVISPTEVSPTKNELLCPGAWDNINKKWDVESPYPSEVRFSDGGGIVEGGPVHYDNSKYYLFYSSGSWESYDEYGGVIAVCDNLTSPCKKILREDGNDIKELIPGSSSNYYMAGRPLPVIVDNKLHNISYHARSDIDYSDDILRCTSNPPLPESFLSDFENDGEGCSIGPMGEFCGNAVCEAGENALKCAQDCGECSEIVSITMNTDKNEYTFGEEIKGSIDMDNNAPHSFNGGVITNIYKNNELKWSYIPHALFFYQGNTTQDLDELFVVLPSVIPSDNNYIGNWKLELKMKSGKCEWDVTSEFSIRVAGRKKQSAW